MYFVFVFMYQCITDYFFILTYCTYIYIIILYSILHYIINFI